MTWKNTFLLSTAIIINCVFTTKAQKPANIQKAENQISYNDLLSHACPSKLFLAKVLLKNDEWVHIPLYKNRAAWSQVPEKYKEEIVGRGEKLLTFVFKSTPASYYLETLRHGDRQLPDTFNNEKYSALKDLILAELAEGKGRFTDKIIDGVFAICEMTSWAGSAHLSAQKAGIGLPDEQEPIVDLFVAEVGNLLSWCHFFFKDEFDKVNPLIAKRIEYTIDKNVLTPYLVRDYNWMGLDGRKTNNWNIWINYNVLNCFLLMEKDSTRRLDGIYRTVLCANNFINSTPNDGGCEEGPGYWNHAGGKMFEYLDLLSSATNKRIDIFNNGKIRAIGTYILKVCLYYPYFVNFADAGPMQSPSPYVVYHFGEKTNDINLQQFGLYLVNSRGWYNRLWGGVLGVEKLVSNLFDYNTLSSKLPLIAAPPYFSSFWLSDSEIAGARDSDGNGFCFAAKGGYNAAPHGHNDAGSFILFYNKKPLFVDAGVGTYTIKTFSKERYTIWSMQSAYHNLVTINGKDQKEGKEFKASDCVFSDDQKSANFSVNVAKAYESDASVKSWVRNYKLNKGKNFTITDIYDLITNNGQTYLNLLTPATVDNTIIGKLIIKADGGNVGVSYNPTEIDTKVEEIKMTDVSLEKTWPNGLRRIRLHFKSKSLTGKNSIVITPEKTNY